MAKSVKKKSIPAKKKTAAKPKSLVVKKSLAQKANAQRLAAVKPVAPSPAAEANPKEEVSINSFFKAKIKVIGIGGGGTSIVSEIGRALQKATFVVADTDARAFKKRSGIKHFLFGQNITRGLGTGLNPELGRQAAEQEKDRITSLFEGQDIVIFVASLGGGLGSGATKTFIEASKKFNGISLGIFTLPFKFEGKNKYRIALKHLRELRRVLNVSITIPNEKIFKIIDSDTAITSAFSMVNKSLIESLESLIDLIHNPGIINIDFADLKAILNGEGNLAFLNTVEAAGSNRLEKITERVLNNPLSQGNNFTAEKILFNIEGGSALSMFEVDKISRVVADKNPKAKIIFGISRNPQFKNKVKTTLLMVGPGVGADAVVPVAAKAPAIAKPKTVKKQAAVKKAVVKKKVIKLKQKTSVVPEEKKSFLGSLLPTFDAAKPEVALANAGASEQSAEAKKNLRRSALEIKKEEELKEHKKTKQEEEWEIPAFLRLKK